MNEQPESTQAPEVDVAPSASASETTISLSQVQSMIDSAAKKAHDAAFAEARRTFEGKKPKPSPQDSTAPNVNEMLSLRDVFDDGIDSVKFPNKRAKGKMRDDFLATKPESAADWIADYAEMMGWADNKQPQPQPNQNQNQRPANATPASDAGSPSSTSMGERPLNVLTWSEEDKVAYYRQHAKVPGNPNSIQNRETHRAIKRMTEAALADMRVQLGPRKG